MSETLHTHLETYIIRDTKSYRAEKPLNHEYLLAKIGVYTAENGLPKDPKSDVFYWAPMRGAGWSAINRTEKIRR